MLKPSVLKCCWIYTVFTRFLSAVLWGGVGIFVIFCNMKELLENYNSPHPVVTFSAIHFVAWIVVISISSISSHHQFLILPLVTVLLCFFLVSNVRSLFVLLCFFVLPLFCLFFDLRLVITPLGSTNLLFYWRDCNKPWHRAVMYKGHWFWLFLHFSIVIGLLRQYCISYFSFYYLDRLSMAK